MNSKYLNILPLNYHSRNRLFSNSLFWVLLLIAIFPLFIAVTKRPAYILYTFSSYITLIWGILFISFFAKKNDKIIPLLSAYVFVLFIIIPLMQGFNYVLFKIIKSLLVSQKTIDVFITQIFFVALKEELFKIIPIFIFAYYSYRFSDPLDGMIFGIGAGLGFAAIENIIYLHNINASFIKGEFTLYQMLYQGLTRIITLSLLHSIFTGISGYFVGVYKFSDRNPKYIILYGLTISTLLHGLYNFFVIKFIFGALIITVISYIIFMNIYLKEKDLLLKKD